MHRLLDQLNRGLFSRLTASALHWIRSFALPNRSFVKRSWHCQKPFSNQIENKPCSEQPQQTVRNLKCGTQSAALCERGFSQFFQAGRANHSIVMLRDTLAAKELPTRRTPCHRFTLRVIEASLQSQAAVHGVIFGGISPAAASGARLGALTGA